VLNGLHYGLNENHRQRDLMELTDKPSVPILKGLRTTRIFELHFPSDSEYRAFEL
jgi:hypothetical protein